MLAPPLRQRLRALRRASLAWLVTGLHDARREPLGAPGLATRASESRSRAVEAPAERRGSSGSAAGRASCPKLELWTNWAYSRQFHHVFGRLTYLGQPVYGMALDDEGLPARRLRAQRLSRHAQLGVRLRLAAREQLPLAQADRRVLLRVLPARPVPRLSRRREAPGGKGRALPGDGRRSRRLPDVTWEGAAPAAYDAALDRQLLDVQRALYGESARCKPL